MTATSGNNFIQSCLEQQAKIKQELLSFHYPNISEEEYWLMLKAKAEEIFLQRAVARDFIADDYNRHVIRQLYYYLIGDQARCEYNVNKGIYLMGAIGCGKSVLMYAYLAVQDSLTRKITTTIHAKQLFDIIADKGIQSIKSKPLFIDELGRENLEMRDYGNVIKPVIDLFAIRYEFGGRTYATSNFTLDTLEATKDASGYTISRYGSFIRTRMDEIFNIVMLPGGNRRLKFEK